MLVRRRTRAGLGEVMQVCARLRVHGTLRHQPSCFDILKHPRSRHKIDTTQHTPCPCLHVHVHDDESAPNTGDLTRRGAAQLAVEDTSTNLGPEFAATPGGGGPRPQDRRGGVRTRGAPFMSAQGGSLCRWWFISCAGTVPANDQVLCELRPRGARSSRTVWLAQPEARCPRAACC